MPLDAAATAIGVLVFGKGRKEGGGGPALLIRLGREQRYSGLTFQHKVR